MHIFIVILFVCCVAFGTIVSSTYAQNSAPNNVLNQLSGDELFERGKDLTAVGRHEEAANLFWGAVMKANGAENYKTDEAFEGYLTTFQRRDILDQGYLEVARKYAAGKQTAEAVAFIEKALDVNPENAEAMELLEMLDPTAAKVKQQAKRKGKGQVSKLKKQWVSKNKHQRINRATGEVNDYTVLEKRVEAFPDDANAHLALANQYFTNREWSSSLHHYARAYNISAPHFSDYLEEALREGDAAVVNAGAGAVEERLVNRDLCYSAIAYLKSSLGMWGSPNATGEFHMRENILDNDYATDMQELENIVRREMNTTMLHTDRVSQSSVIHPHMTLGFPIDPEAKLRVAKSHAEAELVLVLRSRLTVFKYGQKERERYHALSFDSSKVNSNNSNNNNNNKKKKKTGGDEHPPNNKHNMAGYSKMKYFDLNDDTADSKSWDNRVITAKSGSAVGWTSIPGTVPFAPGFRIKIGYVSANIKAKSTVYMAQDLMRFHDRSRFEVHVYATTPQDTEQFLKGTMLGVDWRAKVAAGVEFFHEVDTLDVLQLSKLIRSHGIHILLNWDGYSNNGVRATGLFPLQVSPIQVAHQEYIGTMGASYIQYLIADEVAIPPSFAHHYTEKFIYMPHSFLANSFSYQRPHMFEPTKKYDKYNNPQKNACGAPVTASFVYCNFNKHLKFSPDLFKIWLRVLQSVDNSMLCLLENPAESIPFMYDFIRAFDESLVDRVRFQPFSPNPYDNQRRGALMCNAILDSQVYNGHTTAGDALWGGVPILTYGEDEGMAGRVGASALTALGLEELIAHSHEEYKEKAVRLGLDKAYFSGLRGKLVDSVLQRPRNPFWDMRRYVRSLENGFEKIWRDFISNVEPRTVYAVDPLHQPTNSGVGNESNHSFILAEAEAENEAENEKKIIGGKTGRDFKSIDKSKRKETKKKKEQKLKKEEEDEEEEEDNSEPKKKSRKSSKKKTVSKKKKSNGNNRNRNSKKRRGLNNNEL